MAEKARKKKEQMTPKGVQNKHDDIEGNTSVHILHQPKSRTDHEGDCCM